MMRPAKHNLKMDKAMGLISSLLDIASSHLLGLHTTSNSFHLFTNWLQLHRRMKCVACISQVVQQKLLYIVQGYTICKLIIIGITLLLQPCSGNLHIVE